ncbi:hypothetical protein D6774_01365, partial [Candidatus Woesearchaeota archaeon]
WIEHSASDDAIGIIHLPIQERPRDGGSNPPRVIYWWLKKVAKEELDISVFTNLIKKIDAKTWLTILAILVPLFLAFFFRAYPAYLPITDHWAEQTVQNNLQSQISAQINARYPNLPPQNRQALIEQEYQKFVEQNKAQLDAQIKGTSEAFKQKLKNDHGETYLLAIDPYFYYQYAENYLQHGHYGTTLKDGKPWDSTRLAPLGSKVDASWHPLVLVAFYKVLSVFDRGISLMGAAFWVPAVLAALCVIPAFLIVRRKTGNLGGFVAAMLVGIHTAFLSRTPAGFADTDAYNVLFPLFVCWLFLEAFESKERKHKLLLSLASGITLGLYSKFWMGWWYIFDILVVVIVGYMIYVLVRGLLQKSIDKQAFANAGILAVMFVLSVIVTVSLLFNFSQFLNSVFGAISFTGINNAVKQDLWPNVFTTVAELNDISLAQVMVQMGGRLLFILALFGVIASLIPLKKWKKHDKWLVGGSLVAAVFLTSAFGLSFNPFIYVVLLAIPTGVATFFLLTEKHSVDIKYALLILVWFVVALYATTKGVRFTLVLVPVFSIAVGTAIGWIYQVICARVPKMSKWSNILLIIFLCLILVAPIRAAHGVALNEVPSMNDAWYDTLVNIDQTQPKEAIITSWWDFGHWFKAIAKRPVTFDGGSQNTPMAHWVGKLLLTSNEAEAIGIQRMLNCGSYTGFDVLLEQMDDGMPALTVRAKKLMDKILLLDEEQARAALIAAGISNPDAVLEKTHCEPPTSLLITSEDMVGKAGVWGHFGSWDFERAYIVSNLAKKPTAVAEMENLFGYNTSYAQSIANEVASLTTESQKNTWVSGWPGYMSGWLSCTLKNEVYKCPVNVVVGRQAGGQIVMHSVSINLSSPQNSSARIVLVANGRQSGSQEIPITNLAVAGEEKLEHVLNDESSGFAILLDVNQSRILVTAPEQVMSLFTQLFFLEGRYNEHYELLSAQRSFTGQNILVWKTKYE